MTRSLVIAIDGPSYVGKSTVSRSLAELMGYTYVNTGHMYRAVARLCLAKGIALDHAGTVSRVAHDLKIRFETEKGFCRTIVEEEDWSKSLDEYETVLAASKVAKVAEVRQALTEKQRAYAKQQMIVMEGRDIGSVVFPDAVWKFFITASLEVRAKRMYKMIGPDKRSSEDYKSLISKVQELDEVDMKRQIAPLKMAEDAILYDNSDSPSEIQDALILQYYINHGDEVLRNSNLLSERQKEVVHGKYR